MASNHTASNVLTNAGPFDPAAKLRFSCTKCGHSVTLPGETWNRLLRENLSDVLPDTNINDRELIVSGALCGDCFDVLWPEEEDAA
jgi:hypothetical protein